MSTLSSRPKCARTILQRPPPGPRARRRPFRLRAATRRGSQGALEQQRPRRPGRAAAAARAGRQDALQSSNGAASPPARPARRRRARRPRGNYLA